MACNFTRNIVYCNDFVLGGVQQAFFTNRSQITSIYYNTGDTLQSIVTFLNPTTGITWLNFTMQPLTALAFENQIKTNNGQWFFQKEFDCTFDLLEPVKRNALMDLINSNNVAIVYQSSNGNWFIMGDDYGCRVASYQATTDTLQGNNQYVVKFQTEGKYQIRNIDVNYVNAYITPTVGVPSPYNSLPAGNPITPGTGSTGCCVISGSTSNGNLYLNEANGTIITIPLNISGGSLTDLWKTGTTITSLQPNRSDGSVNSGNYSTIVAGQNNKLSGIDSIIGGGTNNFVGGNQSGVFSGRYNSATTLYSVIAGGNSNKATSQFSFIGNGLSNIIATGASYSFIGAGHALSAMTKHSIIVGGKNNIVFSTYSSIVNGFSNYSIGTSSTILGGELNKNFTAVSSILGGYQNTILNGDYSIIGGGANNKINSSGKSIIIGGTGNINYSNSSLIGAGNANKIKIGVKGTILGGDNNYINISNYCLIANGSGNYVNNHYASIINGLSNNNQGEYSFIGGGVQNNITNAISFIGNGGYNSSNGSSSFIGTGVFNQAAGGSSFVGNGRLNTATTFSTYGVIINGKNNYVSGNYSSVLNGYNNNVSGQRSTIINGSNYTLTADTTVLVPSLIIKNAPTGGIFALTIDNDGNVFQNTYNGVNPAVAVQAATTTSGNTSVLIYNNGASGVGATFTGPVNTTFVFDGITLNTIGQRVLIKDDIQSPSGAYNGIYTVTQLATLLLPTILTRATDYDESSEINNTGAIPIINGTVNADTSWLLTSTVNTVGTDPLTYIQFTLNPSTIITNTTVAGGDLAGIYPNPTIKSGVNINANTIYSTRLSGGTLYSGATELSTLFGAGGSGIVRSVNNINTNTTAAAVAKTDYVYLVSGSTVLTLPTAIGNTNLYTIKRVGINTITANTTSSQTIDGSSFVTFPVRYTSLDVISDGANWNVV